jgi:hypothetical protein
MGEPHPHMPGQEEVWASIDGTSLAFLGTELRIQPPGRVYMLPPDDLTVHSNINAGDKPVKFLYFARFPQGDNWLHGASGQKMRDSLLHESSGPFIMHSVAELRDRFDRHYSFRGNQMPGDVSLFGVVETSRKLSSTKTFLLGGRKNRSPGRGIYLLPIRHRMERVTSK